MRSKIQRKVLSMLLALSLIIGGFGLNTQTVNAINLFEPSISINNLESYIYKIVPGDTTVIDNLSELNTVLTEYYVLSTSEEYLQFIEAYEFVETALLLEEAAYNQNQDAQAAAGPEPQLTDFVSYSDDAQLADQLIPWNAGKPQPEDYEDLYDTDTYLFDWNRWFGEGPQLENYIISAAEQLADATDEYFLQNPVPQPQDYVLTAQEQFDAYAASEPQLINYTNLYNMAGYDMDTEIWVSNEPSEADVVAHDIWFAQKPVLADYLIISAEAQYAEHHILWVEGYLPLESYSDMADVAGYNEACDFRIANIPKIEDFTDIYDMNQFNTHNALWVSNEPTPNELIYLISWGIALYEIDNDAYIAANPMPILSDFTDIYDEDAYDLASEIWVFDLAIAEGVYLAFVDSTIEYNSLLIAAVNNLRADAIIAIPEAPVVPVIIRTVEEAIRYEVVGSEKIEMELLNSPVDVVAENSVQGPICHEVFRLTKTSTEQIARTYNFYAEGSNSNFPIYETKEEATIKLTIPAKFVKEGRTFSFICVSDNGTAYRLSDLDSDPGTITISTNHYYAFALVYTDIIVIE